MKPLKALGYCILAFVVFNTSMFTTAMIIDKENENEQITSSITQSSETSTTTEETQTNTTETTHSNESTQEEQFKNDVLNIIKEYEEETDA